MSTNHILIFKTNIEELCSNCEVYNTLTNHADIQQWNIDTDDVDRVLRVESAKLSSSDVIKIIINLGHECQELN